MVWIWWREYALPKISVEMTCRDCTGKAVLLTARDLRSTGYSTGVAKKELNIIKLMTEKAAKLDRDTFGVDGAHGPWQQRLAEIGGIKPLAFGQFGEMGPGLEALLASVAKRGADEMADRYLIENREAAVGVQVFHVRQRWGAVIWRAQTQALLGRLKCALPGWEEAESRLCGGHSGGGQLPTTR